MVLAADGLKIVTVQQAPPQTPVQFPQKVLLPPGIKPVYILRLKRGCIRIRYDSDRLEIWRNHALGSRLRFLKLRPSGRQNGHGEFAPDRRSHVAARDASNYEAATAGVGDGDDIANELGPRICRRQFDGSKVPCWRGLNCRNVTVR